MNAWQRRCGSAVTLVEFLVVVALFTLIVVLLFPFLHGACKRADIAVCANNLRQIGMGILSFEGDNNGDFPVAGAIITKGEISEQTQRGHRL